MTWLKRKWLLRGVLYVAASLAIFWWSSEKSFNAAFGSMVLALPVLSVWIAWRYFQIAMVVCGLFLFYWLAGIQSGDQRDYAAAWIVLAFIFGGFFSWWMTILASRGLDRFQALFRNHSPNQVDGSLRENAASPESLHRLGASEKPDDFITLSPSSRKHLR